MDNDKSGKGLMTFLIILIVILISLIGYKYFFINVEVSGESMVPTLHDGDELVLNKAILPKRGDIIVLNIDERDYWIIKRVIGIEGDTIKLENNSVYRKTADDEDFVLLEEDYTNGVTLPNGINTYTVKEGEYFFLGDNREKSADSRVYGLRTREDIIGVVTDWSLKQEGFWYNFNKVINYPSNWFSSCKNTIGE